MMWNSKKNHTFPFLGNDGAVAGDGHSGGSQATEKTHFVNARETPKRLVRESEPDAKNSHKDTGT